MPCSLHSPLRPLLCSLLLFALAAAVLAALAGCDSGIPPEEAAEAGGPTTVQFASAGVSVLEEDRPTVEIPVQINDPGGQEVSVEVLAAFASSEGSFNFADLGIGDFDDGSAFINSSGDTTAYVVETVAFGPDAEDGATQTVQLNIADDVEEGQEVGVFALQNARTAGGQEVAIGEQSDFVLTVQAEGTVILLSEDFQDEDLSPFTTFSVASSENWEIGFGGDASNIPYAMANGFGADAPSNDWLISPALDFSGANQEVLTFISAKGFNDSGLEGDGLQVLVSTTYDGESNPENFEWTDVTDQATLAQDSDKPSGSSFSVFVPSGEIDLSGFEGGAGYLAFKYISSGTGPGTTEAWEVDNVSITGLEAE